MNKEKQIISDITVHMKYSRYKKEKQRRETWQEIVDRRKSMDIDKFPSLKKEIEEAYQYVLDKKVLPSMRSLQFGGEPVVKNNTRINNCSYLPIDHPAAFSEVMFLLLSGCGVGYSVQKSHVEKLPDIKGPNRERTRRFLVGDSIEGWSDSIKVLMEAYFYGKSLPVFDFSDIRPKGSELITSGGKAPGPQPLKDCIHNIVKILDTKKPHSKLSPIEVHDICCYLADAVLAGGIRRAALISLFSFDDEEMIACKSGNWWELNPQRGRANNSAVLKRNLLAKDDFYHFMKKVEASRAGEPGWVFIDDMKYGTNPCCEVSLREFTFCNLCEINGSSIVDQKDFEDRCRVASFIGTMQASYTNFHYLRDIWKRNTEKDALIGVGITGIASINFDIDLKKGAEIVRKTNESVAQIIGINPAARSTTVKPSGCRPWYGLVTTDKGIKTLQELFVNHKDNSNWSPIVQDISAIQDDKNNRLTQSFVNGEAMVYNIDMEGQLLAQSTGNHKWYVKSHYQRKNRKMTAVERWKETLELVPGDIIEVNMGSYASQENYIFKQVDMTPIRMRDNTYIIKQPEKMNTDLAWMLGYLWGDGALSESKYRIRFTDQHIYNLEKAQRVIKEQFGLDGKIIKLNDRNASSLEIGSIQLYHWLTQNGIIKYFNNDINLIPECVRSSSKEDIIAFMAGMVDSDGSISKSDTGKYRNLVITQRPSLFTRHLQEVALSVGLHFNHSHNRAGINKQKVKNIVLMSLVGDSQTDSVELLAKHSNKAHLIYSDMPIKNKAICKATRKIGMVTSVTPYQVMPTFDVEVENEHWFYAGALKSHNTASLVLGASSGIHAWHSEYYIRRIRVGKNEPIYTYLSIYHPELIEDEIFRPNEQAVISIPQYAGDGAITRENETFESLCERIKKYNLEWVRTGHRSGPNYNNVSATVSIKDEEWDEATDWFWSNKDVYCGISVLPYDNGSYKQAPFETISKEKFEELSKNLKNLDLSKVVEMSDMTNLSGELACSAGGCEIV